MSGLNKQNSSKMETEFLFIFPLLYDLRPKTDFGNAVYSNK